MRVQYVKNAKLANVLDSRIGIGNYLNQLGFWSETNNMKFSINNIYSCINKDGRGLFQQGPILI